MYYRNTCTHKVVGIQTRYTYVSWHLQILSPFQQHILALLPLFSSYILNVYRPSIKWIISAKQWDGVQWYPRTAYPLLLENHMKTSYTTSIWNLPNQPMRWWTSHNYSIMWHRRMGHTPMHDQKPCEQYRRQSRQCHCDPFSNLQRVQKRKVKETSIPTLKIKGNTTLRFFSFRWWACSSDTFVYPSIFTFPLLSLHCWFTTTHPLPTWLHAMHPHSPLLHQTSLTYLMDRFFTIHMLYVHS